MNSVQKLTEILKEGENIVFFGGAGVSTESGMKDYRSEDGLYNTVKKYGVSPETILSHTFFFNQTAVFYDFYYNYFLNTNALPNKAHISLAKLEKMGKLKAVITQNIDGLHQKGGSQTVYELHGTVLSNHCAKCGEFMSSESIKDLKGGIPYCEKCGGIIKPDVVLYEEGLNSQTVNGAIKAISLADTLIIGGTSLSVYPAAGFIEYFKGKNLVLINRDETFADKTANLVIRENIGEVLFEAVNAL